MRDDQEFNIRFVEIVKKYPCLYDKGTGQYRNKAQLENAWLLVANEVNESGTLNFFFIQNLL